MDHSAPAVVGAEVKWAISAPAVVGAEVKWTIPPLPSW